MQKITIKFKKKDCEQHFHFPSCLQPQYYESLALFNFAVLMGERCFSTQYGRSHLFLIFILILLFLHSKILFLELLNFWNIWNFKKNYYFKIKDNRFYFNILILSKISLF